MRDQIGEASPFLFCTEQCEDEMKTRAERIAATRTDLESLLDRLCPACRANLETAISQNPDDPFEEFEKYCTECWEMVSREEQ